MTSGVAYRFGAELRRRWLAWLAVGLVMGLAGGLVLALFAGARRTDTAYDRLLVAHDAYDVLFISGIEGVFEFAPLDLEAIASAPGVADSARLRVVPVAGFAPDGTFISAGQTNFAADPEYRYGIELNRFKVLDGRLADPDERAEVMVTFPAAEQLSLRVGDTFRVNILDGEETAAVFASGNFEDLASTPPLETLEVVGIVAEPSGFPPAADPTVDLEFVYLTPAMLAANPEAQGVEALAVRLDGGAAAVSSFVAGVQDRSGELPVATSTARQQAEAVNRALAPLSRALLVSGVLAAVVAALVTGQILARQHLVEGVDAATLDALGYTRRDHGRLRLLKAATIGAVAAGVAAGTAVLLSPRFPIGLGRTAEPEPGMHVDVPVVIGGAVAVLAVTVAIASLAGTVGPGRRWLRAVPAEATGEPAGVVRPGLLARQLARVVPGPVAPAGTHLALDQRGTASSLLGIGIGLVTVLGMLTFVASLDHLRQSPHLYGWTWDLTIGGDFGEPLVPDGIDELAADPDVAGLEAGAYLDMEVDGARARVLAADPVVGDVAPALLSGRQPRADDEIVLGPKFLPDADAGELVDLRLGSRSVPAEVVGRAVLPGADVLMAFDLARRLTPESTAQLVVVDVAGGVDQVEFARRATDALGLLSSNVETARLPQDLVNFGRADATPAIIAVLMGVVTLATLLHALLTAVYRGRRTLAVLRTVGFTRRQLVGAVTWQASLLVLAALVVAVPLGVGTGRLLWLAFADELGVVARPVVPVLAAALTGLVALLVGALVAGIPGWRASKIPAAVTLRAD